MATSGSDTIPGTAGADSIDALAGDDSVDGQAGSDTLIGNDGNDTLIGGTGSDYLIGGAGSDFADFSGASGPITVKLGEGTATGQGNDTLDSIERVVGTAFADTFFGGDLEHDTVYSLLGEFFEGREGNDTINGWVNPDRVLAPYPDATTPFGGSIFVLASYLNSPSGVTVNLGAGTASDGFGGTDTLVNVTGVQGSNNDDSLTGGTGYVVAFGSPFELYQPMGGNDTINGGAGFDRVSYYFLGADQPITITLSFDTMNGATGTAVAESIGKSDLLFNIEQVQGGAGDDSLTGSNRTDTFEQFRGSEGDDTIDGMGGFDVVQYFNSTSGVTVNLQAGTASDGFGGTDSLSNIEGINGSNFDDSLTGSDATLNGGAEFLEPLAGTDTVDGGGGLLDEVSYNTAPGEVVLDLLAGTASDGFGYTDTLLNIENARGSMHSDTLIGNGANNSFRGLWGFDSMDGGAGVDTANYDLDNSADSITGVNVSLAVGSAIDGWGTVDTLARFENVRGSNFNDTLTGSVTVTNLLDGLNGNDQLQGLSGNDTLNGGGGNDKVNGGVGNDSMTGGTGDDTFWVNAAGDKVIENASEGFDVVRSTIGITLGSANISANVENVVLLGSANINATGSTLSNFLRGNAGNNNLNAGTGAVSDSLNGGFGNDTLDGGDGADFLQGAAGIDVATFFAGSQGANINLNQNLATNDGFGNSDKLFSIEHVIGTAQADTLTGGGDYHSRALNVTPGFEVLEGRGGNDVIQNFFETVFVLAGYASAGSAVSANLQTGTATDGEGGTDAFAVSGNIWIAGLQGSAFNDTLIGGGGYPVESGGSFEIFEGLAGDDSINGSFGSDRAQYVSSPGAVNVDLGSGTALDGFGGTDTLVSIERVTGSSFNDTISGSDGGTFIEVLEGRAGNDIIDGGAGGNNVVSFYSSPDPVSVNLGTGAVQDGWGGTDTLTNIQGVSGSYYNDTLTGSAASDETLSGLAGADILSGGAGFDWAVYVNDTGAVVVNLATMTAKDGWSDTDTLSGIEAVQGSGFDDSLTGSAANESFAGGRGDDTIDGAGGVDTVTYRFDPGPLNAGVTVDLLAGTAVDAFGSHDSLVGIENAEGNNFNDVLYGSAVANLLTGLDGADVLSGGAGTDTLDGGNGDDQLDGGAGSDTMTGGQGDDVFFVGGAGDVVNENASEGMDLVVSSAGSYTLGANLEDLLLAAGGISGTGNSGSNVIQGNDAGNTLSGSAGADTIFGWAGDDQINGGNGIDTLAGGTGADVFTFDAAVGTAALSANRDVVRDFQSGVDQINLALAKFAGIGVAGNLMTAGAFNSGIGMTTAQDADDRIIYDSGSGKLYYDADGSAAGSSAVLFMTLSSAAPLAATDIHVI